MSFSPKNWLYQVDTEKSLYEVSLDMEAVVLRHGFLVLHRYELLPALAEKNIELDEDTLVFEVSNLRLTEAFLAQDMSLALLLPWRINIDTEQGNTRISFLLPTAFAPALEPWPKVSGLLRELEARLIQIIHDCR